MESSKNEPSAYLYLGQLYSGKQAIPFLQRGITILRQSNDTDAHRRLSSALCSLAETYMTDCCFEPNAEQICEESIQEAVAIDPTNPEVFQTLASVRLSQQNLKEAKKAVLSSLRLWLPRGTIHQFFCPHEETIAGGTTRCPAEVEECVKDSGGTEQQPIPSYPSRLSLAKILLELREFHASLNILSQLQQEDDEVFEVWYLLAMTYWCLASTLILETHGDESGERVRGDRKEVGVDGGSEADRIHAIVEVYVQRVLAGQQQATNEIFEYWLISKECLDEAGKVRSIIHKYV
jgi:tetratricopeptide (TPR) repeat protein